MSGALDGTGRLSHAQGRGFVKAEGSDMSSSKGGGPEWDRLGKLLEQRRVEMNPRYRDLTLFAQERGLNWRLAWDIEKNRRTSYRDLTLSAIESATAGQQVRSGAFLTAANPSWPRGQLPSSRRSRWRASPPTSRR
jgi:hypothetical protein